MRRTVNKENEVYYTYKTGIGNITISCDDNVVTSIRCGEYTYKEMTYMKTDMTERIEAEINRYLEGKLKEFTIPVEPEGTEFQRAVWNQLLKIPYGETKSYKDIAELIGNPKACRAVGMANNRNPIMIVIPCHRVIGADGSLIGYGGGVELKYRLLKLEQENS